MPPLALLRPCVCCGEPTSDADAVTLEPVCSFCWRTGPYARLLATRGQPAAVRAPRPRRHPLVTAALSLPLGKGRDHYEAQLQSLIGAAMINAVTEHSDDALCAKLGLSVLAIATREAWAIAQRRLAELNQAPGTRNQEPPREPTADEVNSRFD